MKFWDRRKALAVIESATTLPESVRFLEKYAKQGLLPGEIADIVLEAVGRDKEAAEYEMYCQFIERAYAIHADDPLQYWFLEPALVKAFEEVEASRLPIQPILDRIGGALICYPGGSVILRWYDTGLLLLPTPIPFQGGTYMMDWHPPNEEIKGMTVADAIEDAMRNTHAFSPVLTGYGRKAVLMAVNAALYFTSVQPAIETLEDPDFAHARKKGAPLPTRKEKTLKVFRLIDVHREPVPRKEKSEPVEPTGRVMPLHNVRPHWRWQACGPRYSQHRLTWVRAHTRGSGPEVVTGYRLN